MTEIRRPASEPTTRPITVRPAPVVVVASLVGAFGMAGWMLREALLQPTFGSIAAGILFTAIGASAVAALILQRVELDGESVRIVRVVTTDVVDRADVVAAHQSGGRGRPAFIRLRDGVATNAPSVDATRWPPRSRRTTGASPVPSFLTARQVATALDVPLRSWKGGDPSRPSDLVLGNLWRGGTGLRRVLLVLLATAVVAFTIAGLLLSL